MRHLCKDRRELGSAPRTQHVKLEPEQARRGLAVANASWGVGVAGIHEQCKPLRDRDHLPQQLRPLGPDLAVQIGRAGNIGTTGDANWRRILTASSVAEAVAGAKCSAATGSGKSTS